MLNMEEINAEIAKLEKSDCTSYEVCRKLAILYIVRDHYRGGGTNPVTPQMSSGPSMVK